MPGSFQIFSCAECRSAFGGVGSFSSGSPFHIFPNKKDYHVGDSLSDSSHPFLRLFSEVVSL